MGQAGNPWIAGAPGCRSTSNLIRTFICCNASNPTVLINSNLRFGLVISVVFGEASDAFA